MCNILIYFCNIQIKRMKHPDEISETLEIYACNLAAWTNVGSSLRSSTPARMSAVAHGARRCGSGAGNSYNHQSLPKKRTSINPNTGQPYIRGEKGKSHLQHIASVDDELLILKLL
jgi:hypothetical protein